MLCVIGARSGSPHTSGTNELHALPPAARSYALLVLVIQVQGHYRIKFCQYFLCSVWGQTATPIFPAIRYTPHTSLFTCDSLNDVRCVAISAMVPVWHYVQAVCVILPIDYSSVLHVTFSVLAYLMWTQVMEGHKASCYVYTCSYTCTCVYVLCTGCWTAEVSHFHWGWAAHTMDTPAVSVHVWEYLCMRNVSFCQAYGWLHHAGDGHCNNSMAW